MAAQKYNGRNLSLMFDGTQEFNADGTEVTLDHEEADQDTVTFAELSVGAAVQWFFSLTAVADYGSGTVWDLLWSNSGQEITYLFKPYGNSTPSTDQPHFSGSCIVNSKPPIGGDTSTWTYEARLDCTGEPTRVTA